MKWNRLFNQVWLLSPWSWELWPMRISSKNCPRNLSHEVMNHEVQVWILVSEGSNSWDDRAEISVSLRMFSCLQQSGHPNVQAKSHSFLCFLHGRRAKQGNTVYELTPSTLLTIGGTEIQRWLAVVMRITRRKAPSSPWHRQFERMLIVFFNK